MLVFAAIVGFLYSGVPAQLLTVAQIGGVINTPILGIMTILLCNRKDEMASYKVKTPFTVVLSVAYIFVMITVINNLINIVRGFLA